MGSSRDAFRKTMLAANTGRPVFVPIVYRLAARIEQTPLVDMVSDPTSYANILEGAWKLLKQDAIVTGFDHTLEAEIFGCQVDWPGDYDLPVVSGWMECDPASASLDSSARPTVLLESTKRLVQTRGRETAIVGVITGPCSLARMIADNSARDIQEIIAPVGSQLARLVQGFGETKVDAIIIREDLLAGRFFEELLAHEKAYTAAFAPMFNLTRFYNVAGLFMVRAQKTEDLAELARKLGPGGFVLSGQEPGEVDLASLMDLSVSRKMAIGLPLPLSSPEDAFARLQTYEDFISRFQPGGFFYVSDGEVPPDVPLDTVLDIAGRIKGE